MPRHVLHLGEQPRADRDAGLAALGGDAALGIAGDLHGLARIGGLGGAQNDATSARKSAVSRNSPGSIAITKWPIMPPFVARVGSVTMKAPDSAEDRMFTMAARP